MAYQSIFSSNSGSSAAPSKSGGGGYSSIYGSATIQAPSPQALATSRQQRTQAKQKQDDQAKAQAQAQAKQQADKAKQSSLFSKVKRAAGGLASAATTGEKQFITPIARRLPGGTADIEAQQEQATKAADNIHLIRAQQKAGKISAPQANKIITEQAKNAAGASKGQTSLLQAMPTKKQVALGAASTAADLLTAGSVGKIKAATEGAKVAKVGLVSRKAIAPVINEGTKKGLIAGVTGHVAANATAGGLNAAAGGGSKQDIVSNAAAGAILPEALRVGGQTTAKALDTIMSKVKAPKALLEQSQAQAALQAAEAQTLEKNKVAASKVDQKIELIEAKKADGKFTNVDKVKVKQLQAEKQQLTGDTAPSTTPKPLIADAAVPAKPGKQTAAVSSEASIAPDEGKVFYHGTNNPEIKTLADLQTGKEVGKSSRNRVYITENPEVAKNFGSNVVSSRLYGKHLNAADIGVKTSPDPFVDKAVAKEFSDYKTSPLLSEKDKRVFENSFVKDIPNNTIIEDTPNIHKYLASKGYTTITVPRIHSDVNGPRTETIIIDPKAAHTAPQPTQIAQHPATGTVQQHMAEHYKPVSKHPDEAFAHEHLTKNTSAALHAYEKRTKEVFGSKNIVGGDDAKYSVPGMAAEKSSHYHEPASQFAKGYYKHLLADTTSKDKDVLITAGGTGSGKTSALKKDFKENGVNPDDYAAIVDTNLTSLKAATSRIDPALESGRPVTVQFVYRDPVEAYQNGVIPRARTEGRAVTAAQHGETHAGSIDAIKQLADYYKGNDSVQIRIIDNSRGKDNSIPVTLDFLKDKSYTKSEIEAKIHTLLDDHLKEGKISHEEHAVFKGQEPKTTTPSKPQQQVGQSRPDVRPVERPPKPEAERQPQPTGQSRQVAAAKVTSDTPSVTDAKTASRVYERLKAEHPELQDDVSYDAIKLKEDSQKAVDLLAKDKQKAFEVAMGQTPSSEVTSTAVNIAMAEKALQEGNHKLYAQLITNRSLAQTRRGQELVAEKGSVTDNSTARYVKELLASRLDKLGKKYMNDIDLSMKKLGPKERATAVIDKEVTKLEKQIKSRKLDTKTALSMLKEMECL